MNKQAVNTFKLGLVMDLNPLANDNKSLTNALNATFITQNGNELMLLNDMGNGRINRVRLDDGYIPVGIKEYGGIIYVASYNPKNGKGQIGSFPYPKLEWESGDFKDIDIPLNALYGDEYIEAKPKNGENCTLSFYQILDDSLKIPLLISNSTGEQVKVHSGDSFSIVFDEDTKNFLKSSNINIKIVVKTSSSYYTVSDNKLDIINGKTFVYGGSYSGVVYLQIDLIVYNDFEVDYTLNLPGATIYPRAFNPQLGSSTKAVLLETFPPEYKEKKLEEDWTIYDLNTSNVACDLSLISNSIKTFHSGVFYIYPITLDGGYIANLRRKLIIPDSLSCNNVSLFKYYIDNNIIRILLEYLATNDEYNESGNITYKYRFYPIRTIENSINSLSDLQNLYTTNSYSLEISKSGYTTKSGVRYVEAELPENEIYLLVVSCQKLHNAEEVLLTRFIYGTQRYNVYYDDNTLDDFNLILKTDIYINYTLDSNIFLPELLDITHYHYIDEEWVKVQDLVRHSEEPFDNTESLPKGFRSVISILLNKTTDPFIECVPEENYKYIFDRDSFLISINDVLIEINDCIDNPQKNSNNRLVTGLLNDQVLNPIIGNESLTFYRYISSTDDDGTVLQDRVLKTLAPVFDPNNLSEELLSWEYDNTSIRSVICAKDFLTASCNRILTFGTPNLSITGFPKSTPYSYLLGEETLTTGTVKLTNLQAALLNHSEETTGNSTPSIFDTYSGGKSCDGKDFGQYQDAADHASLRILRRINTDDNAGIFHNNTSGHDEIDSDDKWMIATCLNIKGKPMPINLAGGCFSKIFDGGTFVGDYVDDSGSTIVVKEPNLNLNNYPTISDMNLYTYINVAKKVLFLLSLLFTLQNLLKNVYLIGPSITSLNYNIQDSSYITYTCNINYNFTSELDNSLEKLERILNSFDYCNSTQAINYIGSIKSNKIETIYNYGHLVNMGSLLFGNILEKYENAYDDEEVIDESKGYSDEEIYYLDAEKILNGVTSSDYSNDATGSDGYIWPSLGIKFNKEYHCFCYDLNKLDTLKYISKSSTINSFEYLIDWTGCKWRLKPIASSFITVFKAQRNYSSVLSGLNNNFIVLNKTTTNIPTKWTKKKPDATAPGIVFIDFGARGLVRGANYNSNDYYPVRIPELQKRLSTLINYLEHQELIENQYYNE